MKLVLPGGSGHLGTLLARAFHDDGHEVVVVSRRPVSAPWRSVAWDGATAGAWSREIDGADVVINLAGRSVNCRYTPARRREIVDSRLQSTRAIGDAIRVAVRPPALWLQSSTATIYAHRYDAPNDERTGRIGGDEPNVPETWRFSIEVATSWERAFREAAAPATRKVALRTAIVMFPEPGGAFDILLRLVRCGLGGASGDGRQYVSWIHHRDFIRAVRWLIDRTGIDGVVNLAAPAPLPNADFMRALRAAWGARMGLPSPAWLLEIGAVFLGTETELVLKSRRVVSARLPEAGFSFDWPDWPGAAGELVAAWRLRTRGNATIRARSS